MNNTFTKMQNKTTIKAIIFYLLICLFSIQIHAQISLGGGLGYNEKISGPGVTIKGVFNITENIAVSPSASYFFGTQVFGYKQNLLAGDVNAHYYFHIIENKLNVYPIVGANFSSYKTGGRYNNSFFSYDTQEVKDSAFGGNIGAGGTYQFSEKLKVYLEPKFIVSDYSQIVINAGVLLSI